MSDEELAELEQLRAEHREVKAILDEYEVGHNWQSVPERVSTLAVYGRMLMSNAVEDYRRQERIRESGLRHLIPRR